jgi:hypothetical protein
LAADLTAYNAALKEVWTSDKLEDQLYQGDPLLDRVERTSKYNIGEYAVTPILTGRSSGYSVVPGSGASALNAAGNAVVKQAKWGFTHHHQQIKVEGSAIDQTTNTAVAVANAVDTEMTSSLASLRNQLTRQLFTYSDGKIAQISTGASSATQTLTTLNTNTPADTAITRRWLQPGMTIDLGTDTAQGASSSTAVISSFPATNQITFTGSVSTTTGDFVRVHGSVAGSATPANRLCYEMYGLPLLVSQANSVGAATYFAPDPTTGAATTGFGSITVASEPEWKAASVDSTTTTLTLPALYDAQRSVMQSTGTNNLSIVTGYKQQQRFYELLQMQVRFAGDNALGAGNTGGAEFAGMKVDAHVDCPDNFFFFLNLDDILVVKGKEPYWQNSITGGDPLVALQSSSGGFSTAFGGMLTYRLQLAAKRRNSHAALTALT